MCSSNNSALETILQPGNLTGWRIGSTHAPELLGLELETGVLLPHVVISREENDRLWVGGEGLLDGADGSCLIRERCNGSSIGDALPWPSGLGHNNFLVLVC